MQEKLITFETAKLAKEKGFGTSSESVVEITWTQDYDYITKIPFEPCCFLNGDYFESYIYSIEEFKKIFKDDKVFTVRVKIPTQSLLQKWLREVHNIHLNVEYYPDRETKKYCITGDYKTLNQWTWIDHEHDINFNTYEEALELGLKEGLELIEIVKTKQIGL